jgi:hypothetical protein
MNVIKTQTMNEAKRKKKSKTTYWQSKRQPAPSLPKESPLAASPENPVVMGCSISVPVRPRLFAGVDNEKGVLSICVSGFAVIAREGKSCQSSKRGRKPLHDPNLQYLTLFFSNMYEKYSFWEMSDG